MKNIMNKVMHELKENRWLHYIIIIVIGIILSITISQIKLRDTHIGVLNILRIEGTMDTLSIRQVPPIINPNYCRGARLCNESILSTICNIFAINYKAI